MIEDKTYMPDKFRIGHAAIDMQHEVLFVLYNELLSSLQHADDRYVLSDIFLGLNLYVATHFQYEEEMMLATQYHDLESHCEEHHQLKESVRMLHERFSNAKSQDEEEAIAHDIAAFLADWLAHHIAQTDRQLARYLNQQSA